MVWGEQTQEHAIKYLTMRKEAIVISGAAQFEIYKQEPVISRQEYRKRVGVLDSEKVVCYAGSSKGLNEMHHLELLDKEIRKHRHRIRVIYRPRPWKDPHEAEENFNDYQFEFITMDSFSIANYEAVQWGDNFRLELMDYEHTNVVLNSVDGLISPVSTILLEAAMFGVPIAAYASNDGVRDKLHFDVSSRRTQYTEFFDQVKEIICEDISKLWTTVVQLVERSEDFELRNNLANLTEYFVQKSDEAYADTLVSTIEDVIGYCKKNDNAQEVH